MFTVRLLGPLDSVLLECQTHSEDYAITVGVAFELSHPGMVQIIDSEGVAMSVDDFREERRV